MWQVSIFTNYYLLFSRNLPINILLLSFSEFSRFIFTSTFVCCFCSLSFFFFKKIYLRPYDTNMLSSFTLQCLYFIIRPFVILFTKTLHLPHISVAASHIILKYIGRTYFNISISCFTGRTFSSLIFGSTYSSLIDGC